MTDPEPNRQVPDGDSAVAGPAGPTGHGDPATARDRHEPTGHPAVDGALAELRAAAERPPGEQVPAYERAHQTLRQTLASIDD